jgi:hypothetical protein
VAADDAFESRRDIGVIRRDNETFSDFFADQLARDLRHRVRGLPSCDYVRSAKASRYVSLIRYRPLEQTAGIGRSDPGPDDGQEIVSKLRTGNGQ